MNKIGRNDPCPCGSGQKYKKCCLAKEELLMSRRRDEDRAVHSAIAWLDRNYEDEVAATVLFDFMNEPDDDTMEVFDQLPPQLAGVVAANVDEWLLADAELEVDGESIKAIDLILGKGGPILTAHGREWLQELGKRPLTIYEVKEVIKGQGLLLTDLLDPDQPPVRIREVAAAGFLAPRDTFGARLVWQDDSLVMSGAVYPMDRETALDCVAEIREESAIEQGGPSMERYIATSIIIDYWMDSILETEPVPELVDGAQTASGAKVAGRPRDDGGRGE